MGCAIGLGRGELLGLPWENVDLEDGWIKIVCSQQRLPGDDGKFHLSLKSTKTKKGNRTVKLPAFAVKALHAHKARQAQERLKAGSKWQEHARVFCGPLGQPINPTELYRLTARLLKKAGLPHIPFKNLMRHSAASLLLAQGWS